MLREDFAPAPSGIYLPVLKHMYIIPEDHVCSLLTKTRDFQTTVRMHSIRKNTFSASSPADATILSSRRGFGTSCDPAVKRVILNRHIPRICPSLFDGNFGSEALLGKLSQAVSRGHHIAQRMNYLLPVSLSDGRRRSLIVLHPHQNRQKVRPSSDLRAPYIT
jgi:hypothetical protein